MVSSPPSLYNSRVTSPRSFKRILFRASFSVAFGCFLLEIALRFFWLVPTTAKGAYFRRDDHADHMHYAHGIGRMKNREFDVILRMNNIGMRDDDVAIPKPPGRKRVIVIGDSFMEGWGCQRGEIFTDLLETALQKERPATEVVAAGVASWAALPELAWLKHEGLALEPDAVVIVMDVTDPAGDSFYAHRLIRDGQGRPDHIAPGRRRFELPKPAHEFLSDHSFIYRYLDRILTKKFPLTLWDYGYWHDGDDVWAPARGDSEIPQAKYESYWTHSREAYATIRDLLEERKIPWLLVQFPTGAETDSSAWILGRGTANFAPGRHDERRFEYMDGLAARDSLPYFSLLQTFRNHPDPASLFFPYDGHWSKDGHRVAAEAVAAEMRRRGIPQ